MWNALTDEERDVYNKQADAQTQPIQRPTPIVAQQLFNQQSVVQPLTQAPLARAPLDVSFIVAILKYKAQEKHEKE
jgi:hypothetical protein